MQARLVDDPDRLAEIQHQGLLGLAHGEERTARHHEDEGGERRRDIPAEPHGLPPNAAPALSAPSGSTGSTPAPDLSMMVLSAPARTDSMVSM